MKVMFEDMWKVNGVIDGKICFQSKIYADECCLISEAKFVNKATNEAIYMSVSEGKIVEVPHEAALPKLG